ncbi:hypothetical protein RAH41_08270 [Gottfriedia acidiceleris]|uniref:DUF7678 domain-containing protein n=1 Tax=Gottfriedia acidiceleris TaxID=371036 RepID=UPI002F264A95
MKFTYRKDKRFGEDSPWFYGQFGNYEYTAKVFDDPEVSGFRNGRVKKFSIYDNDLNEVVGYDGGVTEGSWKHHLYDLYDPLIEELENAPTSTDSYYSKVKKYWGF